MMKTQPHKRAFLVPLLFMAAIAATSISDSLAMAANALDTGFDASRGVIFEPNRARELLAQCSRSFPKVDGTWAPTASQIAQFEALLAPALQAALLREAGAQRAPKPSDYYRQYGGIIVAGHRVIYANGFHRNDVESTQQWKGVPVDVCDSGYHYWAAAFDVDAGRLVRFLQEDRSDAPGPFIQFNGYA